MKIKRNVLVLACLVIGYLNILTAQPSPLWIPPHYQQVYDDSLHMYDGTPGPNYWQNHAAYDIRVEVDPATRMLSGQETVIYYNESPDTLDEIVLRLHQDIYKRGMPRTFPMPDSSLHDGVTVSDIRIGGTEIDQNDPERWHRDGTLAILTLPEVLLPASSLEIRISWLTRLPVQGRRTGFVDATSAFIGYWYPQVAVYDAISGWDRTPYLGRWEFYQDYADFQVAITLPDAFVVWGTGMLQNPEELLSPRTLRRYRRAQRSNEVVHIVDSSDIVTGDILQKNGQHTWLFKTDHVPDFAFAFSDHYLWDGISAEQEQAGAQVFVQTAYARDTTHLTDAAEVSQNAIRYLATNMPGVSFPYNNLLIFDGLDQGGMEFPMMINFSRPSDYYISVFGTFHEIAHMYFPFLIGTNETEYAWMDEGFAMYLPWEGQTTYADTAFIPISVIQSMHSFYEQFYDLPMISSSDFYFQDAYYRNSYQKPELAWLTMEDLLGKDTMQTVFQEFIHRWQGKHPLPWDLFFTFNDVLDEDLSWFWEPWFYETHIPDIGIKMVDQTGTIYWVTLENHGGLPTPVDLTVTYADSTTEDIHQTARIWEHGNSTYRFPMRVEQEILSIELIEKQMVDMRMENNQWLAR